MTVAIAASPVHAPLVFERVTLFQQDRLVLEDLSFALCAGELACLSGVRCAGMAGLLRLACGQGDPTAGEVRICGLPSAFWSPQELARRFRLVTPAAHLFIGCTLAELLADRCHAASAHAPPVNRDLVRFALARAGMTHLGNCEWGGLSEHERRCAQLAFLFVRLWSAPPGVRLVIVDEWLDGLPSWQACKAFAVLRHFAVVRAAAVLATLRDSAVAEGRADRLFVMRHDHDQNRDCDASSGLWAERHAVNPARLH